MSRLLGRFIIIVVPRIAGQFLMSLELGTSAPTPPFLPRYRRDCVNLAVGYLVLEVVSLWINAKLASEQTARASI